MAKSSAEDQRDDQKASRQVIYSNLSQFNCIVLVLVGDLVLAAASTQSMRILCSKCCMQHKTLLMGENIVKIAIAGRMQQQQHV